MKVIWKLGRLRETGLFESSLKYTDFALKKQSEMVGKAT